MGKRTVFDTDGKPAQDSRHPKRQRIGSSTERNNSPRPAPTEEVTSARQLQKALVFEQGTATGFRHGAPPGLRFSRSSLTPETRPRSLQELPRLHPILDRHRRPAPQTSYTPRIPRHPKEGQRRGCCNPTTFLPGMGLWGSDQHRCPDLQGHCGSCASTESRLCQSRIVALRHPAL
jgi:hypothetical protein